MYFVFRGHVVGVSMVFPDCPESSDLLSRHSLAAFRMHLTFINMSVNLSVVQVLLFIRQNNLENLPRILPYGTTGRVF